MNEILFHITTTGEGVFYADDVTVNSVKPVLAVWQGHSMALGDDLDMRFHVAVGDGAEVSLQVSVAGNTAVYTTADAVKDEETGNYIFSVSLAAAQMTDVVTAQLFADGELLHSGSYTVKGYAEALLSETHDEKLVNLLQTMLNYGGRAQSYFAYNTENLVSADLDLTGAGAQQIPGECPVEQMVSGSVSGVRFYGASMVFRSKVAVRYYFNINETGTYTFTVNGEEYTPKQKDGLVYIEISDINPQDYSQSIAVEVSDGTDTMTVTYCPMNYIVRKSEFGTGENLKQLLLALYNYHLAAAAYQK